MCFFVYGGVTNLCHRQKSIFYGPKWTIKNYLVLWGPTSGYFCGDRRESLYSYLRTIEYKSELGLRDVPKLFPKVSYLDEYRENWRILVG